MTKINLRDFIDYDRDSIHEFLLIQDDTFFEIGVIMDHLPSADSNDVFAFYSMAGYIGQLLKQISKNFSYSVPGLTAIPDFRFRVRITDMAVLRDFVYHTATGLYCHNNSYTPFYEERDKFWSAMCAYDVKPAAWGLLQIANENTAE